MNFILFQTVHNRVLFFIGFSTDRVDCIPSTQPRVRLVSSRGAGYEGVIPPINFFFMIVL